MVVLTVHQKKSADGKNLGTSEAQKESKEMSQHSVQDEAKNGDDDDDDQLETFVVQTAQQISRGGADWRACGA